MSVSGILLAYFDPTGACLNAFCIILLIVAWINAYAGLEHGASRRRILAQMGAIFAVVALILVFVSAWSLGLFMK